MGTHLLCTLSTPSSTGFPSSTVSLFRIEIVYESAYFRKRRCAMGCRPPFYESKQLLFQR